MRTDHEGNFVRGGYPRHSKLNTIVTAAVFIIVGLLFLGRNFGVIDSYLFDGRECSGLSCLFWWE